LVSVALALVEEMAKITKPGRYENLSTVTSYLVIGLNSNEEIVEFNTECENITGFSKADVLYRRLSDVLIPEEYSTQWETIFDSMKRNIWIDDFTLPLKTQQAQDRAISWNSFPIETTDGMVKNICLIGKYLPGDHEKKQSFKPTHDSRYEQKEIPVNQKTAKKPPQKSDKKMEFKHKNKKIIFKIKRRRSAESKKTADVGKKLVARAVSSTKKPTALRTPDQSIQGLLKQYETVRTKLQELEKKDRKLERKNKQLEKNLQRLRMVYTKNKKLVGDTSTSEPRSHDAVVSEKRIGFDPFGIKKKREDIARRTHALEEREKALDKFETTLSKDKKTLQVKIRELSPWRKKLEKLEAEIEKRRGDLDEQEEAFKLAMTSAVQETYPVSPEDADDRDLPYHTILDKIPESAAIVQRGILKQINGAFATLLGYDVDEIVEKSFFDFIAPEGLAEIEKYYFLRLKGDKGISTYKTVFCAKDNHKILVEVSIKPTTYDGEQADMAVVTALENP